MSDRAHQIDIAARQKFLAEQAKERERINAECVEAEKGYREWTTPKRRHEKAQNDRRTFESQSSAIDAERKARIAAAADPRIHAAIRSLEMQQEELSAKFSVIGRRENPNRASNAAAYDARLKGLRAAHAELNELLYVECVDVPAAINQIFAKIPPFANWS